MGYVCGGGHFLQLLDFFRATLHLLVPFLERVGRVEGGKRGDEVAAYIHKPFLAAKSGAW